MNSESHYLYDQSDEAQGLGRISLRPVRLLRVLDTPKPVPRPRSQKSRPPIRPRPAAKPKPVGNPRPVIDENPAGAPTKLTIPRSKKATKKKPPKKTKAKLPSKSTGKQPSNSKKNVLAGTFQIGGVQVTKTHAAMATGGIAGGLLLWKILF